MEDFFKEKKCNYDEPGNPNFLKHYIDLNRWANTLVKSVLTAVIASNAFFRYLWEVKPVQIKGTLNTSEKCRCNIFLISY